MSASELMPVIEKAIRDVANNPSLVVKAESKLVADLGLESIDLLDVSSELENALGYEIDFRDVAEKASEKCGAQTDMKSLRVQDVLDFVGTRH